MISNAKISIILTLIAINIAPMRTECNVCSAATDMACVSETQYQACVNNSPTGSVNTCPNSYICSTATSTICQSSSSGFPATCSGCNVCDANSVFACTGINTYALCLGTNMPSSTLTNSCGQNLVCDINLQQICGDPRTGIVATCPSVVADTTTTSTTAWTLPTASTLQTFAQCFCQFTRINARFALPSELDTSCKNYVYCFLTTNGTWSGQFYTCAGSTYFDSYSRYCVATRPSGC